MHPNPAQASIQPRSALLRTDWYVLRMLNYLRLTLLTGFAAAFYLWEGLAVLGSRDPQLFAYTHITWLLLALVFNTLIKLQRPALEAQFFIQAYADILMVGLMIYASGGIQSQLGLVLIVQIVIIAGCARQRYALLFAAISASVLLSQELYARYVYAPNDADLTSTGVSGLALFLVAIICGSLMRRLHPDANPAAPPEMYFQREQAQELQSLPRSKPLSVKQVATLTRQIVAELDTGLLYLDNNDSVQFSNRKAVHLLSADGLALPLHVGLVSEPLYQALRQWRRKPDMGISAIQHPTLAFELLPQFIQLDDGGLLIKLQDRHEIQQHLQQLKLAALGRMAASIAHEIRNPLSAARHALQMLQEELPHDADHQRLMDIALNQTQRINRIVGDITELSRQRPGDTERKLINLSSALVDFQASFIAEQQLAISQLQVQLTHTAAVAFDLHQLQQILWNLCHNALVHNPEKRDNGSLNIAIVTENRPEGGVTLSISDNGDGIDAPTRQHLFEPFFTTRQEGVGLGLFIIKELCALNDADIAVASQINGSCFQISMPPLHLSGQQAA